MDNQNGFSTNTLFNSLRSQLDLAKDKFSCEQIQEIMNIMTDLEHEVNILQTHYQHVAKQSNYLESISDNVTELLEKMASGTHSLDTIHENYENTACDGSSKTSETELPTNIVGNITAESVEEAPDSEEDVQHLAKMVAKYVVEELQVLDNE